LRRKLSDWIDSGYLKLYLNPSSQTEMCCLGFGSQNAMAAKILDLSDHDSRCLITRSEAGVKDAYLKIQSLVGSSIQVNASQLEDPGTRVIRLQPSSTLYSIDDLRSKIGLTEILNDKTLVSAEYYDRYFDKQRGRYGRMFARLLTGPWLTAQSVITIHTEQQRDEAYSDQPLERLHAIQGQLQEFVNFRLQWRDYKTDEPRLQHARTLSILFSDKSSHIVTFDKGIDFAKRVVGDDNRILDDCNYRVVEEVYVVTEPG
jgi:hypothetical protein